LGRCKPVFSPIYDTARGLFWNDHEDKLTEIYNNKSRLDTFIKKYAEASSPKIGWEGIGKINHFDLIEYIKTLPYAINCESLINICSDSTLNKINGLIDNEFSHLFSEIRRSLIKSCLKYRHQRIKKIFNFAT